jgi:Uma2 family endonuclease
MVAEPIHPLSFPMTEEEYLVFEEMSQDKHEYANGYIYAMSGGTSNHSAIASSTLGALIAQLRGSGCRVYNSDLKIHIATTTSYRYPDVSVICGDPVYARGRKDLVTNPVLLVEVLSSSTAIIDLHQKLEEYLKIESLHAYLIISQDEAKIARYMKDDSGRWMYDYVMGLEAEIALPSLNCTLALSDVYEQVIWDEEN